MKKNINLRSLAAQAIEQVVEKGQSLSNVLPPLQQKVSDKDKALLQELCFGVLRTLSQLEWLISKLMARPMTGKQRTVHFLIMVGLYQLLYTRIPPHAALAETVEGAVAIKRPQLKGLINGVLRQFQRQQEALLAEFAEHENRYLHPKWLLKRLQQAWPEQWQEIVEANNQRPPMWLRVNRNHHSRDEWLALLNETGLEGFTHPDYPDAVRLATPAPVHALPGFAEGWVTVQDASAQGCIRYLQPENGERILDLCAAPGGKSLTLAEAMQDKGQLVSGEFVPARVPLLQQAFDRCGITCAVAVENDATQHNSDWPTFDRVLCDVPCSGLGVIAKKPDIRYKDLDGIENLLATQQKILQNGAKYLAPNGRLVYSTCTVSHHENEAQVRQFLQDNQDFSVIAPQITLSGMRVGEYGTLFLPHETSTDGFFAAILERQKNC